MSVARRHTASMPQCGEHCTDLLHITYMGFAESRVAARLTAGVTIGKRGVFGVPIKAILRRMHSLTVLL
jgi:hypothetical protein